MKSTLCWWQAHEQKKNSQHVNEYPFLLAIRFDGHPSDVIACAWRALRPKTEGKRNEPSTTENSLCTWRAFNYSGMKAIKGRKAFQRRLLHQWLTSMKFMAVWWDCNSIITMGMLVESNGKLSKGNLTDLNGKFMRKVGWMARVKLEIPWTWSCFHEKWKSHFLNLN